jgi:enterochelin esterase-like enzyme
VQQRIRHQYRQLPGGHDWRYWDRQIHAILNVFAELTSSKMPRSH